MLKIYFATVLQKFLSFFSDWFCHFVVTCHGLFSEINRMWFLSVLPRNVLDFKAEVILSS